MAPLTNTAPGSAGQNGALGWADELIAHNRKRLLIEAAAPDLLEALQPLARIADAYDANELDDEARKFWGIHPLDYVNKTPPERIELYQGRGGKRLLTLADCFAARTAIAKATGDGK